MKKMFQKNRSQRSQKSQKLIISQLGRDFYVTFVTFFCGLCDFLNKGHIKVISKSRSKHLCFSKI